MSPRRRVSWSHVIDILDKYLALKNDWPVMSPLGRLNEGGTDGVRRDEGTMLAWFANVGGCLAKLPKYESDLVMEVTRKRQAEDYATSEARKSATAAQRSGAVRDVRDDHSRSKREWLRIADDHRRDRRRLEKRQAYEHGMDLMCVLIAEIDIDK